MKRVYSIIVLLACLCGAVSCTDLLDESLRGRGAESVKKEEVAIPEGAHLTLGFNVPMPVATKAMTQAPKIDSIHVLVFSNNGVSPDGAFLEIKKAELGGLVNKNAIQDYENHTITNADEPTVIARWNVDLMMGRGIRHIHFVANLPKDFQIPEQGTDEFTVMRSIQSTGGDVAYWQMVVVEDGILAYTYNGSESYEYVDENGMLATRNIDQIDGYVPGSYSATTQTYQYRRKNSSDEMVTYDVGKGDYITTEGLKVLDGGGYYASLDLSRAVNLIPLVRNFASIKVLTTSSSNFRLKKAILINTPESGYVAPFDDASNLFVEAYRNVGSSQLNHAAILATGYPATIPSNSIITAKPDESAAIPAVTNATATRDSAILYMYERGIPSEKATSLLVYGALEGVENDRWFKIEISDTTGVYFPMYRDFTYEVNIKSISGSEGYTEMGDAYDNDPIGDISNSNETKTLTKIDDGKGLVLWVEYIDKTSTDTDNHSVRLLYKFYKGSNNYSDASHVTLRIDPVTGRAPAINSDAETLTGAPYSGEDTPDGNSGWYTVSVPLYGSGDITKVSTLHVEGKLDAKTMFRNVTYRVMQKQHTTLSNEGLENDAAKMPTSVSITLPDYLGYSVFPLTLKIEAENKNLNPADGENLSVESGLSLFSTATNKFNSFYFLKTVEYDDYLNSKTVTCNFVTTQESGNQTWVAVSDKGGYFFIDSTKLNVQPMFKLSAKSITVKGSETEAVFDVRSNTTGTWTLTANNGATLSQYSGSGSATISVTLPVNTSETEAKTYKISASIGGDFEDQELTITQSARQLITVTGAKAEFVATDFRAGTNVEETDEDITVQFSTISSISTGGRIVLDKGGSYNVSFMPQSTAGRLNVTITNITVTFRNNNYMPASMSGFTLSGDTATYNGSSTGKLTATITPKTGRSDNATQITSIDVTYSYQYYE